jgi:hypothetical protein
MPQRKDQANNRRTNHKLTYFGNTKTITAWANEIGISARGLLSRIRKDLNTEQIFSKSLR